MTKSLIRCTTKPSPDVALFILPILWKKYNKMAKISDFFHLDVDLKTWEEMQQLTGFRLLTCWHLRDSWQARDIFYFFLCNTLNLYLIKPFLAFKVKCIIFEFAESMDYVLAFNGNTSRSFPVWKIISVHRKSCLMALWNSVKFISSYTKTWKNSSLLEDVP